MKIVGAINAYQDAPLLALSLPKLRELVDVLILVDGAYSGFPIYDNSAESTDGTLELAGKYVDIVVRCPIDWTGRPLPWQGEFAKRTQYLRAEENDYYLVCDADEVVEFSGSEIDRDLLYSKADWQIPIVRHDPPPAEYPIHRLFRHRKSICYMGSHEALHVNGTHLHPEKDQFPIFPGLKLRHRQDLRSTDRNERKGEYYRELYHDERPFRLAHKL